MEQKMYEKLIELNHRISVLERQKKEKISFEDIDTETLHKLETPLLESFRDEISFILRLRYKKETEEAFNKVNGKR